jgi:hypothetical protein
VARRASLRASDADREQVAERLRSATAEGRLLAEELEERLGGAFSARTYGELDALVADLPRDLVRRRSRAPLRAYLAPAVGLLVAIPLVLAIVAAVVLVVTGLLAVWALWVLAGWWLLGHRRACGRRAARRVGVCGPRRAHPRPGLWL